MILVDSTIYIDLLRRGTDPAYKLEPFLDGESVITCGIIAAEVLRGITAPKIYTRMEDLFFLMPWIDIDKKLWKDITHLAWQLDRKGTVLPLTDICIASCCLTAGAGIVTTDSHFSSIPGLKVYTGIPDAV